MDLPYRDRPKRPRNESGGASPSQSYSRSSQDPSRYYQRDRPSERRDYYDRDNLEGSRNSRNDDHYSRSSSSSYSASSSSKSNPSDRNPIKSSLPPSHPIQHLAPGSKDVKNDDFLRTTDFSTSIVPVIDEATYSKRIEEQLAQINELNEEEKLIQAAREKRRQLLEKYSQSSTSTVSSNTITNNHQNDISKPLESTSSREQAQIIKNDSFASTSLLASSKPSIASNITKKNVINPVDSDDDMFSEDFVDKVENEKETMKHQIEASSTIESSKMKAIHTDPTDDDEGYYSFRVGEILNGRFEVLGYFGKGVYSNVVKARDIKGEYGVSKSNSTSNHLLNGSSNHALNGVSNNLSNNSSKNEISTDFIPLAIKLLRNNAHMKRSGKKEVKILRKLDEADPEGKCNCIKMLASFEERGHLCLVFEPMDLNLTEVIKRYGHHVGLSIKGVRAYAFKLMKSLALLKKCNIIHADIKPDNILVSKDRTTVKLADFGTAFESQEYELTTQLVSRYYRAPEIILGMPYSFPLDMFSMGCCLYELATGRYLLPSNDDNHHLKLIMDIKGPFSKKMLQACEPSFLAQHFTNEGTFLERYTDPLDSSRILLKHVTVPQKPKRDLGTEILEAYGGSITTTEESEWVHRLADLINQCLTLDPRKRITPEDALQHSFF